MKVLFLAALTLAPVTLRAQWVAGADTLSLRAIADSQAVLRNLNASVRKNPGDAALRFHVGSLAWALAVRDEFKPSPNSLNGPLLKALADSSLRLAVQMAPANAAYEVALARFLRASSDPVLRITAPAHVDRAVELVRASPDSALRFSTMTEAGRLHWLAFDTQGHSAPPGCSFPPSIEAAGGGLPTEAALKLLHNDVAATCTQPHPDAGEADYIQAENMFRDAYGLRPADGAAFRRVAMLFAEKQRWAELTKLARDRIARIPADGWAWLSLGLALHRSGQSARAAAVFDTAAATLDPAERRRLFAFERVLRVSDSAVFVTSPADRKASWERAFWTQADPLWSREGNDPRTEFLARVTYADLRWTVEEYKVRGADSDRGEIYIRYGPPDLLVQKPCFDCKGGENAKAGDVLTVWDYDIGITVVFWGSPTYGTAKFPAVDGPHIDRAIALRPASFDNVAAEKIVEMPLRMLRFRGPGDSVDVLVMTQAPMTAVRSVTSNATVVAHAWMLRRDTGAGVRDSSIVQASGDTRGVYRVSPATYMYRVETTASGTTVAGRATGDIAAQRDTLTGFTLQGFGISDILLATATDPDQPLPARWRNIAATPLVGILPPKSNLDVIWENYDSGARGGQAQYSVAITLQKQRSRSGRVAAAVLGAVARTAGVNRRDDRVTFTFERTVRASQLFLDHVSLGLADTPEGEYTITIDITDKVTGRKTSRTTGLVIAGQ